MQNTTEINNKENNKCKHCKNCQIYHVCRTDKEGKQVCAYTYCEGLKEFHDKSNWLFRGQGEYISSTDYVDGKYVYLHRGCITNPSNCIDHIDHNKTNNILKNLYECTPAENSQNKNNGDSLIFHNVKVNRGKYKTTYTAYKKIGKKTITIGTFSTDLMAYDAFVNYCQEHDFKVNPNTIAFQTYSALKSTNSIWNHGVVIGGAPYEKM